MQCKNNTAPEWSSTGEGSHHKDHETERGDNQRNHLGAEVLRFDAIAPQYLLQGLSFQSAFPG
jgi:hypothetical protein